MFAVAAKRLLAPPILKNLDKETRVPALIK